MQVKTILLLLMFAENIASGAGATAVKESDGKTIFEENCIGCHGAKGDGKGAAAVAISGAKPRDFTAGKFKYGSSDDELFKTVTAGVPGTAMPPWNTLSEKDRRSVIKYIRSFAKKK